MLYKVTRASTQQCSRVSSKPWPRASDVVMLAIPEKRSYLRKPSTTSSERVSPETISTRSDPSKKLPQGTKRTKEKSTSTFHAKMGRGELQNGSSGWMEGRWRGTRPTMPQEISPSSWTFMPRENTLTTMLTNHQGTS